jgi:hypothetical protein
MSVTDAVSSPARHQQQADTRLFPAAHSTWDRTGMILRKHRFIASHPKGSDATAREEWTMSCIFLHMSNFDQRSGFRGSTLDLSSPVSTGIGWLRALRTRLDQKGKQSCVSHARCLKAARISALPTTAAAIARPRVMPNRSTPQQAMSASGASAGRGSRHEQG